MRVSSRAMGKDQAVAIGIFRSVQKSDDVRIDGAVNVFANGLSQGKILNPEARRVPCSDNHRRSQAVSELLLG